MSVLTYTTACVSDGQASGLAERRGRDSPFSADARVEAGFLLRKLQAGHLLGMPHSRPMPSIGPSCHELRIPDAGVTWRIIYRVDDDAVVIAEVFPKKQQATPVRSFGPVRTGFDGTMRSCVEVVEWMRASLGASNEQAGRWAPLPSSSVCRPSKKSWSK